MSRFDKTTHSMALLLVCFGLSLCGCSEEKKPPTSQFERAMLNPPTKADHRDVATMDIRWNGESISNSDDPPRLHVQQGEEITYSPNVTIEFSDTPHPGKILGDVWTRILPAGSPESAWGSNEAWRNQWSTPLPPFANPAGDQQTIDLPPGEYEVRVYVNYHARFADRHPLVLLSKAYLTVEPAASVQVP